MSESEPLSILLERRFSDIVVVTAECGRGTPDGGDGEEESLIREESWLETSEFL